MAEQEQLGLELGLPGQEGKPVRRLRVVPPLIAIGAPSCGHPAPPWAPPGPAVRCPTCCLADIGMLLSRAGRIVREERGSLPQLTGAPTVRAAADAARRDLLDDIERAVEWTTAAAFEVDPDPASTLLQIFLTRGLLHRVIGVRERRSAFWLEQAEGGLPAIARLPRATPAEVLLALELQSASTALAAVLEERRQVRAVAVQARRGRLRLPEGMGLREAIKRIRRAFAVLAGRRDPDRADDTGEGDHAGRHDDEE